MKEISNDTGLATYGLDEVQKALNYGAVDTLILSENLDIHKIVVECSNCEFQEVHNSKVQEVSDLESTLQDKNCPECGSNAFNIVKKISIIEELGEMAESTGSDIEIISSQTEEGEMLYSTFGGIVAILRYKINY
jgi:peptide chain release factor subunit 1